MKFFSKSLGAALVVSAMSLSVNAATTIVDDLLTKTISAPRKNPQTLQIDKDPCGQIGVGSNVAFHPHRKMLINTIDPVKLDPQTNKFVEDDNGATCFSGNVAVMPCEKVPVAGTTQFERVCRKLLVNEINPVKFEVVKDATGNPILDPCLKTANGLGKPVRVCVPDDTCGAVTKFSGGIRVKDHIIGQVDAAQIPNSNGCYSPIVLKFEAGENVQAGAWLCLTFVGVGNGYSNDYDAFWQQYLYVSPNGQGCVNPLDDALFTEGSSSDIQSCINNSAPGIRWDWWKRWNEEAGCFEMYIYLETTSSTDTLEGCLHYEVAGCLNLKSVMCSDPEIACD